MANTVLITGASRGIGRASAIAFAHAGYHVAANYFHSKEAAQTLMDRLFSLGCDAEIFQADVSDRSQAFALVENVSRRFGHIDVLINNAGIAQQKLFSDITQDDWRRMFAVNLDAIFYTCQAVLPQMIRRQSGRILNLSSIWGISGGSCEVHYSASKAAVIGLTKALAKEVGPSHITVNCVAPGVIDTEMNAALSPDALEALREETPLEVLGSPDDVAALLVFLASPAASFITGQVISPNGGYLT